MANMFKKKFGTLTRSNKRPKSDLWVRIKGVKMKSPYHCVWPPFCKSRPDIDWASLTSNEATFPHIRLHRLSGEDSLTTFLSFLEQLASIPATMAIVLINNEESYDLDEKFTTQERDIPVPVVVVKKKAGEGLLKMVERHARNIEANIEGGKDGEEEGKLDAEEKVKGKGTSDNRRPHSLELEKYESLFAGPEAIRQAHPTSEPCPSSPVVVKNGLKVRLKSDTTSSCRCFDYVPGPFNASLHPIPWVDLTTAEATFQHIRLHELNNEDSLSFFMFTMASVAATMGIILINSENNYTLSKEFQSEEQGSQVSVVMVTKETGKELLKLARENIREIEAMVELPPGMKTEGVSTPLSPLPWTGSPQRVPGIVEKGLKVRSKLGASQQYDFDYTSAPVSLSLRPVNWVDLTTSEATYPHIRLHELNEDDSLSFFLSTLASIPATLLVVLINAHDGYELTKKFSSEEQGSPVPMVVVTKKSGKELLRLVEENARSVEARVDLSPAPKSQAGPISLSSSQASPTASDHKKYDHTVIKGGLEIHLGSKSGMSRFDYGWGSFNQSLRPIQKMPLTLYEATFPHIRLHKLTKDDSLQFFMSMMASIPATLGVVLINFDNSYQLSEKFLSNGESPIVPVILVTNETGSELLHFLHENPRDTEVTVHSEDYQPPEPSPLPSSAAICVSKPEDEPTKGLHVRIGVTGPVTDFEYVPGPFRQEVYDIDWVPLTTLETTSAHVRIHELKEEDSLSFFMSAVASSAGLAVIFINSENTFRLAEKFQSEGQSPPVPVLVVTSETGQELKRLVRENPREMYVKVDRLSLHEVVERGGLQVQLSHKHSLQPTCFDYRWARFNQTPRTIDWRPLALQEVTFPHIRLHQMHDRDSLGDFLTVMDSIPATMAVILVNTDNSLQLADKFVSEGQSPIPVLVVSADTGRSIVKLMEGNQRGVEARVETVLKGLTTPNASSPLTSLCMSLQLSNSESGTYETRLVKRGIEVRLPTEETKYFDFAWPPFCNSPRSLNWLGLARHQVMFPHIQINELKHGESLGFFLSTLGSMASAMALILVNVYDGFKLDQKFHPENEGPCVPTLVVPRRTGVELFEILRLYDREVQVRVHSTGMGEEARENQAAQPLPQRVSDEWDVIPSPPAEDVPSLVESLATYTVITDGLLVKSKKRKKEKLNKFDYVWASFCSMRQEIDWTKFVLSTSIPKTDIDCICLHDIRKNQNLDLYRSLLESPNVRALVLINSFNSYKVPHELRTQTNASVLVVTKSTGEALTAILKDNPEARVEFGGQDKQLEWLPAVEPAKLEWENSGITRPVVVVEDQTIEEVERNSELIKESERRDSRVGEKTEEERSNVRVDPERGGGTEPERGKGRTEEGEGEEVVLGKSERERSSEPQSKPTTGHTATASTADKTSEPELDQSLAEFLIVEVPPTTPHQPATPNTHQKVESLTPSAVTRVSGADSSLCESPILLPRQNIVPYNPGPYTGDDVLGGSFLSDVSASGCVTQPGEHIERLLPTSSSGIDWRKPIVNGLQMRPIEGEQDTPQYFTYQWSRVTDSPQKLDWITITEQDDCPEEHIHLHQLTRSTDLQLLVATLDTSSAAALLLINNKNSYEIDSKFFPPGEIDGWAVPIIVVTADTGKRIKSLLASYQSCGVEGLVDIEPHPLPSPEAPRGRVSSFLRGLIGGSTD